MVNVLNAFANFYGEMFWTTHRISSKNFLGELFLESRGNLQAKASFLNGKNFS